MQLEVEPCSYGQPPFGETTAQRYEWAVVIVAFHPLGRKESCLIQAEPAITLTDIRNILLQRSSRRPTKTYQAGVPGNANRRQIFRLGSYTMKIEKTHLDYSRLSEAQKNLLQQCYDTLPENTRILEITSDYPKYSGYFKTLPESNGRVIQIVRGPMFIEKGDNLNFDRTNQVEFSIALARNHPEDSMIGLMILDCSLFISDLASEYNSWNAFLSRGSRLILPLQEYGMYDYERLMSLPSFVMKAALQSIGLLIPQLFFGNIFTGLLPCRGRNIGLTELKNGAIDVFNRIISMRDAYADTLVTSATQNMTTEFKSSATMAQMLKNEKEIGIDTLCFSYFIEYYFLEFNDSFTALCEKVLRNKYSDNHNFDSHFVIGLPTWKNMQEHYSTLAKTCALDDIILKVSQCENLEQLDGLLMREQLKLLLLQDLVNPLYYIMLGNTEIEVP